MRMIRTYPQPDSPAQNMSPRERALAVFKYLLNIEPTEAAGHVFSDGRPSIPPHPLFACIVHSYEQAETVGRKIEGAPDTLAPSLVPMLTSGPKIEPKQGESL